MRLPRFQDGWSAAEQKAPRSIDIAYDLVVHTNICDWVWAKFIHYQYHLAHASLVPFLAMNIITHAHYITLHGVPLPLASGASSYSS